MPHIDGEETATMNISLPEPIAEWIEERIRSGNEFTSVARGLALAGAQ